MRAYLQIGFLLLSIGLDTHGVSTINKFTKIANADLLLYQGDDIAVSAQGRLESVPVDPNLSSKGGACCEHEALPSLSHDGVRVAYVKLVSNKPRKEAVAIYNLRDHTEKVLFGAFSIWSAAWSPQDDRLLVVAEEGDSFSNRTSGIYIVNQQTGSVTSVIDKSFKFAGVERQFTKTENPSWSSSGKEIAFSSGEQIFIWYSVKNEFKRLGPGKYPSWAPVGSKIAYYDTGSKQCVFSEPDGSEATLLFSAPGRKGFFSTPQTVLLFPVVWSPNGDRLLFHQEASENLITNIHEFDMRSRKSKVIAWGSHVRVVDWRRPAGKAVRSAAE